MHHVVSSPVTSDSIRRAIRGAVAGITPIDDTEVLHQREVLAWIDSNAPLFRIRKPDDPPKHLVSYFVLYDEAARRLLIIDHVKAKLWLPTGGHVDLNEHPLDTVVREAREELCIEAGFTELFGKDPLFITSTVTRGFGNHTDVSLWYVIKGNSNETLACDEEEIHSYKWLTPSEILAMDSSTLDPHMHRFIRKMQKVTDIS